MKRIVVVGGGISGLTAAYFLAEARRAGAPIEECLFEAGPRLGGALRTEHIDGFLVEAGADSFLTQKSEAIDLCERVGLIAQLIGSDDENRRTWIYRGGKLRALPEGFEFMVPSRWLPLATSPLLTLRDKASVLTEWFLRPRQFSVDESVASFVVRHFSRDLLENVVEPLLGAIYGGDPSRLSAQAVLPRLVEMERASGSLVRAMRRSARKSKQGSSADAPDPRMHPPIFTTLRDGVATLANALRLQICQERVISNCRVLHLRRPRGATAGTGFLLEVERAGLFPADAVILALPAYEAAHLLNPLDEEVSKGLAAVPYTSSLIVAVAYDAEAVPALPGGFGFVVPQKESRRIRACTFVGQKFRGRVPPKKILLRCFLGGGAGEESLQWTDGMVLGLVRTDLRDILGIEAQPLWARFYQWPRALAQYTVGHPQRIRSLMGALKRLNHLYLCGNAYEGIGVPDCIRSGRRAAEDCLRHLGVRATV